jgi:mxaJ protein
MSLSRRGLTDNLVGFPLFDEYRRELPSAVQAVLDGRVDVAILWGPVAGAASAVRSVPMRVTPVLEERDGAVPFAFSIALAVRRDDENFARELDGVMHRKRAAVAAILRAFHVPVLSLRDASVDSTSAAARKAAE